MAWVQNVMRNVQKDGLPWLERLVIVNTERIQSNNDCINAVSNLFDNPELNARRKPIVENWVKVLEGCRKIISTCKFAYMERVKKIQRRYRRKVRLDRR